MKTHKIILALFVGILCSLVLSCKSATDPEPRLLFSRMEISYIKSGGWINTSKLFIHKDGSVEAYVLKQNKADTVATGTFVLSEEDRFDLARLFEPFSTFEPYYEPQNPMTDQDLHVTILVYEEVPDTVMVYMPSEAVIPEGMRLILDQMGSLLDHVIGP
jgi:hypothetical protein